MYFKGVRQSTSEPEDVMIQNCLVNLWEV